MVLVFDNLLENFDDYNNRVLHARYKDVDSQGITYSDVSQDVSGEDIYKALSLKIGFTPQDKINFLRAYKQKQYKHPMWIHSDVLFSDYIAIFMIQASDCPQDDGVAFWTNKELNDIQLYTKDHTEEKNKIVDSQSMDPEKWEMRKRVEFKSNRVVLAPASYFHSTASYSNRGNSIDNCRIVHVLFFNKGEKNV